MSNRVDAGITTAYGAAVRGGYTGTYDEFCAQQAEYAQNAAALEAARVEAVNAQISANQSKVDAQTHAANAAGLASTARQAASQAAGSATAAANSASSIGNAEANCNASMLAAQTARNEAQTARAGAETARDAAQTARTGAETARNGALTAKTSAETARDAAQAAATASQSARDTAVVTAGVQFEVTRAISSGTSVSVDLTVDTPSTNDTIVAVIATGEVKLTSVGAYWTEKDDMVSDLGYLTILNEKACYAKGFPAEGLKSVSYSVQYTGTGAIRFVTATGVRGQKLIAEVENAAASAAKDAAQKSATEAVYAEAQASFSASAAASSASDAQAVLDSIPDDYSTLANTVSAQSVEIAKKANPDGYYQDMTVGNAEQLVSSQYIEDKAPYKYRTSGGSADVGNREYVDKIVGGTVAWNQICYNGNFVNATGWGGGSATLSVANNEATATLKGGTWNNDIRNYLDPGKGHKTLAVAEVKCSSGLVGQTILIGCEGSNSGALLMNQNYQTVSAVINVADNSTFARLTNKDAWTNYSGESYTARNFQLFDLTQMFGSAVADAVYAMDQATAGAGLQWFRSMFNESYYAYNTGELISVSGLQSHDMVGFNQWDEEWESGSISAQGYNEPSDNRIRTKNYIPCIPSTVYYAKTSGRVIGLRFYDSNKQFCGAMHNITKVDSIFDTPRNAFYIMFSVVDTTIYNHDICINISDPSHNGEYAPYEKHFYPLDSSLTLRGVPKWVDGKMYFDGDEYAPDGTVTKRFAVRAYQSGDESNANVITDKTNTVYALSTPTTETAEPYRQLQICDALGTEEFVSDTICPVGNVTRYPANLVKKLEDLPWNFATLIAPAEATTTASRAYSAGSYLILNNTLYKVTSNIANGGTITPGTNVTATTIMAELTAMA